MRAMIVAGAAGVHFEDQLASAKKCGHMGGKVLVPSQEFINKLLSARLAADTMDVPTIIIARTDALGAYLLTSDIDERDRKFCTGERTAEGFYKWAAQARAPISARELRLLRMHARAVAPSVRWSAAAGFFSCWQLPPPISRTPAAALWHLARAGPHGSNCLAPCPLLQVQGRHRGGHRPRPELRALRREPACRPAAGLSAAIIVC
jgi:hypothetical protein